MKVCVVRGCWSANIGNAFLDMGSECVVRHSGCFDDIFSHGSHPRWLFDHITSNRLLCKKHKDNFYFGLGDIDSDYFVFTGMILTKGFVKRYKDSILLLLRQGNKIIFNGAGPYSYDASELSVVRSFLDEININGIITRDLQSYNYFKNNAKCIKGYDCGFFVSQSYKVKKSFAPGYNVINDDRIEDRFALSELDNIIDK